ncbi:hypothetical protein BSL78_21269 [Apostichopus japonicus]|uniref:NTR domain-containing protein n=1 Tax=Stichopus japonicus TaxID=307972 RepID=A0A2G8K1J6_STIJA|nr:hypothetical protein BSL78_21269 [Apostichopus japonicus]
MCSCKEATKDLKMSNPLFVIVSIILVASPSCLGCLCTVNPYTTPREELYCDAYYAIKGMVMEKKGPTNHMIEYTVVVDNVFKGHKFMALGDVITFKTPSSSTHCGVTTIEEGVKYLFTGPPPTPGFGYVLTICQWIEKFTKLSVEEKCVLSG